MDEDYVKEIIEGLGGAKALSIKVRLGVRLGM